MNDQQQGPVWHLIDIVITDQGRYLLVQRNQGFRCEAVQAVLPGVPIQWGQQDAEAHAMWRGYRLAQRAGQVVPRPHLRYPCDPVGPSEYQPQYRDVRWRAGTTTPDEPNRIGAGSERDQGGSGEPDHG